jgi:hypothetical protein
VCGFEQKTMKIGLFRIPHVMEIRSVFSETDPAYRGLHLPLLVFASLYAACCIDWFWVGCNIRVTGLEHN